MVVLPRVVLQNVVHMYGEFQDVAFRNDLAII